MSATAGYYITAEVHERLINNFLHVAFCSNSLVFSGTYTLPFPDVPESLQEFIEIDYQISFAESPVIDCTYDLNLFMRARIEGKFVLLGGIELDFEVQIRGEINPGYDQDTSRLTIGLIEIALEDIEINDEYHLSPVIIERLNEILEIIISENLLGDYTSIPISPVIISPKLPEMPDDERFRLPILFGNFKVASPETLVVAINLFDNESGDVNALTDYLNDADLGLAVNEAGMHAIYDFWWENTTWNKVITIPNPPDPPYRYDVEIPDNAEQILEILGWVQTAIIGILTAGIYTEESSIDALWIDFQMSIAFEQFDFSFNSDGTISMSTEFTLDLEAVVSMQVTTTDLWLFGAIEGEPETRNLQVFTGRVRDLVVRIDSASVQFYLNEDNRLTVDLRSLDIDLPLDWDMPELILDAIVDFVVGYAVESMPPFVIAPAMFEGELPGTDMTISAGFSSIQVTDEDAAVTASLITSGVETYAAFIANRDTGEVHRRVCEYGRKIKRINREYYCRLEDALAAGYNGCYYCLREYDTG
ncbi:hypothetical protein ACKUB1_18340 [Methanospirillum stamsii]|uniref:Uncharacterized protein n=1 Tax=Methanospirillum stamsii TaxID=1277351 RepID=A0A2V2NAT6_9EURY|nr:hypothetical protein [Methanospirillum stamsii]PWR75860.1 hypothetical protein DLD82_02000 [Methanospirillum stamsii]